MIQCHQFTFDAIYYNWYFALKISSKIEKKNFLRLLTNACVGLTHKSIFPIESLLTHHLTWRQLYDEKNDSHEKHF